MYIRPEGVLSPKLYVGVQKKKTTTTTLHQTQLPNRGEYSVTKTLLGRAANMGSKISLLINQFPPSSMQKNVVYE